MSANASSPPVEVIARADGRGQYDLPWESLLVRRDGNHYLVHEIFCGQRSLEGGQYRPYVYGPIPADRVDEITRILDDPDGYVDGHHPTQNPDAMPIRNIEMIWQRVIPSLQSMGRLVNLGWI